MFFQDEEKQRTFWGYVFLAPAMFFFLCMSIYPMFYSFFLSFNNWHLLNPHKQFIFLQNYVKLLSDKVFLLSLFNTFCYAIVIVPVGLSLALFFAVLLNSGIRYVGLYRFMFFVPVITSSIAAGYIWMWLYEPTFGLFNHILSFFGIPAMAFLKSPYTAWLSISIMAIWKNLGFQIVIFSAGLTQIPNSIYEAAEMDGVTGWNRFRHVTLPLLKPTVIFLSITGFMKTLQMFGEIFVMAPTGGPLNSTRSVVFHIQQTAFKSYQLGYSSAMTFVLFLIIMLVTVIQIKLTADPK